MKNSRHPLLARLISRQKPEAPIIQTTPPVAEETLAPAQEEKEEQAEPVEQAPRPSTIAHEEEKEAEQPAVVAVEPEAPVQPEHEAPEPALQTEVSYDIMLGVNGDSAPLDFLTLPWAGVSLPERASRAV